jgi:citronellyl-CoA dehydrogenase
LKLTHEHEQIRRTLRRFIDDEINPQVDAWEAAGRFPAHEVFGRLGELGLLGLTKPASCGGAGLDYSYGVVMAETLGHIRSAGVQMAIGVQTDMATPALARFGSEALQREFLEPSIAGERVACIGVSEPGAGSDVAAIRTQARRDGADYVIDGTKMWITNSLQADWICLLANTTSEGPAHRNKTLICVPMDAPGITVQGGIDKIGMRASDTGIVHFDGVRVPQHHRIGEEGQGFTYQMLQFQEERLWAAANALQMLDICIEETVNYTRERQIFGRPVLDNQSVHFRLAELRADVECLRSLVWRATEHYVDGSDVTELASMAKLKAGRLLRTVSDACLQYWGGMGFTWDNPASRLYRDGRLASIGGGADEVMLSVICKHMGTLPARARA